MALDINAFLGSYPFRPLPDGAPGALLRAMDRTGIERAWVSHLAAMFWRDPAAGNRELYRALREHDRLRPVPAVHPEFPEWEGVLEEAAANGAPAIRCDPNFYGIHPAGEAMHQLARACADQRLPRAAASLERIGTASRASAALRTAGSVPPPGDATAAAILAAMTGSSSVQSPAWSIHSIVAESRTALPVRRP